MCRLVALFWNCCGYLCCLALVDLVLWVVVDLYCGVLLEVALDFGGSLGIV